MIIGTKELILDKKRIENIVLGFQRGEYTISGVEELADTYFEEMYQNAKAMGGEDFDYIQDDCYEDDLNGIYWEVLDDLNFVLSFPISRDDVPEILRFLNTKPGETKESWEKWRDYWAQKEES